MFRIAKTGLGKIHGLYSGMSYEIFRSSLFYMTPGKGGPNPKGTPESI
jgi:hypothetical protein